MQLETNRLLLRPFVESDLERWAASIFADPEVMRYIPQSRLAPLERARRGLVVINEHWQNQGFGLWAITLRPAGELIGQGGLNKIPETGEIEVDYSLAKAYWGRGYATEVARACLWCGFERLSLERIIGLVVPENYASRRVLRKIGMIYETSTQLWGLDLLCYSLRRQAYFERKSRSLEEPLRFLIR